MKIEFFVPGVPVSRKTPHFGKGRSFRSDSDRDQGWMDRVHTAALQARAVAGGAIDGPVKVSLEFVFPAPKRIKVPVDSEPGVMVRVETFATDAAHVNTPDLDNLEKAVMDALKDVVFGDDKMVWKKDSLKVWGRKP